MGYAGHAGNHGWVDWVEKGWAKDPDSTRCEYVEPGGPSERPRPAKGWEVGQRRRGDLLFTDGTDDVWRKDITFTVTESRAPGEWRIKCDDNTPAIARESWPSTLLDVALPSKEGPPEENLLPPSGAAREECTGRFGCGCSKHYQSTAPMTIPVRVDPTLQPGEWRLEDCAPKNHGKLDWPPLKAPPEYRYGVLNASFPKWAIGIDLGSEPRGYGGKTWAEHVIGDQNMAVGMRQRDHENPSAGRRLHAMLEVGRVPKPEPWVPSVDDFDLLPDAGTSYKAPRRGM